MQILIFLCFFVFFYCLKQILRPRNYPAGPTWYPIIGNTHLIKNLSKKLGGHHLAFEYLAKKYKTNALGLKLGGEYSVIACSYNVVRHVLLNEEFEGRPDNFFIRLRCMGSRRGITCMDGPFWMEQRRFVERHLRSIGYGKKQMEDMVVKEANSILEYLSKLKNNPIQFGPFISPSVLNVLWTLSTGSNLSRDDPFLQNLLNILNKRNLAFDMAGGFLNSLPWLRHIFPEKIGYNLIVKLNEDLKDFFKGTIQEHHETWFEERRDDIIYSFITEMNTNKKSDNFKDQQLLAILLDLFFAGALTTSTTIDFVFLNLVMHPEVQEKAAQCLQTAFSPDEPITYSERFKVPYINAVIMETERFHGVVPVTAPRRVLRDTTLDGYTIKKNTSVLINLYSVHFDETYWKDPFTFRPERFIDDHGRFVPDERVLNFAIGRRRCLGELLAKECIFIFVATILRKYKISQLPGSGTLSDKPLPGITLSPRPYKIVIEERK